MEVRARLTWRILASGTTLLVAYMVTGEAGLILRIGVFEAVAKVILYIIHDYVWELPHLDPVQYLCALLLRFTGNQGEAVNPGSRLGCR